MNKSEIIKTEMQPEELRDLFLQGNQEAFSCLYQREVGKIYAIAKSYLKSDAEAEDMTQQVFLKFVEYADQITYVHSWLERVTKNACIDTIRKKRAELFSDVETDENEGWIEESIEDDSVSFRPDIAMERQEIIQATREILESLPEVQWLCIHMKEYEGMAYQEIAERLEIPLSKVKNSIFAAKNKIKVQMRERKLMSAAPFALFMWMYSTTVEAEEPSQSAAAAILENVQKSPRMSSLKVQLGKQGLTPEPENSEETGRADQMRGTADQMTGTESQMTGRAGQMRETADRMTGTESQMTGRAGQMRETADRMTGTAGQMQNAVRQMSGSDQTAGQTGGQTMRRTASKLKYVCIGLSVAAVVGIGAWGLTQVLPNMEKSEINKEIDKEIDKGQNSVAEAEQENQIDESTNVPTDTSNQSGLFTEDSHALTDGEKDNAVPAAVVGETEEVKEREIYSEIEGNFSRDEEGVWLLEKEMSNHPMQNSVDLYIMVQNGYAGNYFDYYIIGVDSVFEYSDGTRVTTDNLSYRDYYTNGYVVEETDGGKIYHYPLEILDGDYYFLGDENLYGLGYNHENPFDFEDDGSTDFWEWPMLSLKGGKGIQLFALYGKEDWVRDNVSSMIAFADKNDYQIGKKGEDPNLTYCPASEVLVYDSATPDTQNPPIEAADLDYEGKIVFEKDNGDGSYVCNVDGESVILTIADDAKMQMRTSNPQTYELELIDIPGKDFRNLKWEFGQKYNGCDLYDLSEYFNGYGEIENGSITLFTQNIRE